MRGAAAMFVLFGVLSMWVPLFTDATNEPRQLRADHGLIMCGLGLLLWRSK